jgi:hypothetical protein
MDKPNSSFARYLQTLLSLGRVSNVPTVWSNCLAGWWIADGLQGERLCLLTLGATFLYLAGMFLNDAFDVHHDRQHRPERPIPSGAISLSSVWQWGLSWLALGLLCFGLLGQKPLLLALVLAGCILLYDATHKWFAPAPFLMAGCRFLLILLAAATTESGINGHSIWVALVLGSYTAGLSFLARQEGRSEPIEFWPCLFLAGPIILALVYHRGPDQLRGMLLSALLAGWILQSLRHVFLSYQPSVARAVSGLLAGIVLVDLLAVSGGSVALGSLFLFLLLLAVLFQRFVPAT